MRKNSKTREGFSLIEMIIAIAIVAIVMSAILVLLSYATGMMRRTNNTVSLQNQSKYAMMHITTHVQEGSEASSFASGQGLVVAKINKRDDGSPYYITISDYWIDSNTFASGGGTAVVADEADRGKGGKIYFTERRYPEYESDGVTPKSGFLPVTDYLQPNKKDVDFTKVALSEADRLALEKDENTFIKNVTGFNCKVVERTSSFASGGAFTTGSAIAGNTVTVQLALVDDSGDATFNNIKDIYMRNQ